MILRRSFIGGLLSSLAASAIVKAASLMRVKTVVWSEPGIAYPPVLDRAPVMIDGVIRYLLPTDARLIGNERPLNLDMSNHSARDDEPQVKLHLVIFE